MYNAFSSFILFMDISFIISDLTYNLPLIILSSKYQYHHIIHIQCYQQCSHIIQVCWILCGLSFPHHQYSLPIVAIHISIIIFQLSNILGPLWYNLTLSFQISCKVLSWEILPLAVTSCLTSNIHVNLSHCVSLQWSII